MNVFDSYTAELLTTLNIHEVEYIIVGGYAVNYHGFRQATGDIDLWIKPDNNNKLKIIEALKTLDVGDEKIEMLNNFDFTKHLVFSDGEEPFKIDFITRLSGITFDEAWQQRIITEIDNIPVPFIHFNHLVLSKFETGRSQDKIDLEELQKIQSLKNKND